MKLKLLCTQWVCKNENIIAVKDQLNDVPLILLYEICLHLSPFGLHVLQDFTLIKGERLDKFWQRVDLYPASFHARFHRCQQIKIQTNMMSNTKCTDCLYNELFSNCLGHKMMDCLHANRSMDYLLELLQQVYLNYPIQTKARRNSSDMKNLSILLNRLGNKITKLTITVVCAKVISENMDLFTPILSGIKQLCINLDSGPLDDLDSLIHIIYVTRSIGLTDIALKCSFQKLTIDKHETVWKSIYGELPCDTFQLNDVNTGNKQTHLHTLRTFVVNKNGKRQKLSSGGNQINQSDEGGFDIDFLESLTADDESNTKLKHQKISNENHKGTISNDDDEDEDLYNFALEPVAKETIRIDTNVTRLNVSLPSLADSYNIAYIPALKKWRNLQSLSLGKMTINKLDFHDVCNALGSSLCELTLNEIDCVLHQNALLKLVNLKKLKLSYCEVGHGFYGILNNNTSDCLEEYTVENVSRISTKSHEFENCNKVEMENEQSKGQLPTETTISNSNLQVLEYCETRHSSGNVGIKNSCHNDGELIKVVRIGKKEFGNLSNRFQEKEILNAFPAPDHPNLEVLEIVGEHVISFDLCQGLKQNRSLVVLSIICTEFDEKSLLEFWETLSVHSRLKKFHIQSKGSKSFLEPEANQQLVQTKMGDAIDMSHDEMKPPQVKSNRDDVLRKVFANPSLIEISFVSIFHYGWILKERILRGSRDSFCNSNLTTLIWKGNSMDPDDLKSLGECLHDPKNFPKLCHLNLSCRFKARDVKDFISLVERGKRRHFDRLTIYNEITGNFEDEVVNDAWLEMNLKKICKHYIKSCRSTEVCGTADFVSVM